MSSGSGERTSRRCVGWVSRSIRTRSTGPTRCLGWSTRTARRAVPSWKSTTSTPQRPGGVLTIRSFGKANFLVISDGRCRIQVYVRQDALSERDFKVFRLLDRGDFVGVKGRVFRTRTNELTIWAADLEFLAKCLVPLPEKWHGLTDVEIRYRQRYLDLIVNAGTRRVFETRSAVLAAIRRFLDARGYLEVETPMMQPVAGWCARPPVCHPAQTPWTSRCTCALPQSCI